MQFRFINRRRELEFLQQKYEENRFQFIILHGRRRVGKSVLLREFVRSKRYVYVQVDETAAKTQLEHLYTETTRQLLGTPMTFRGLDEYFAFVEEHAIEPLVLVLDEYQYLVKSVEGINSIIQRWIDTRWMETKLFLVLCGSEIRMMQELFAYNNPLHGRRTGQWKVEPFDLEASSELLSGIPIEDVVDVVSVFGSMPAYLSYYDTSIDLYENILRTVLSQGHPLFEEPLHLLRQEFREVSRYYSIVASIAEGKTRLNHIADATGIEARTLTKYLQNLIATDLIRKERPIGSKEGQNRFVQYKVSDQFLRFWMRFVSPNRSLLQMDGQEIVLSRIRQDLSTFMGEGFEMVCREVVNRLNAMSAWGHPYPEVGRWWGKNVEFDLVLKDRDRAIFFEFKYGKKVDGKRVLHRLKNNVLQSKFSDLSGHLVVIAREFSRRTVGCMTFSELWKVLRERTVILEDSLYRLERSRS